PGAPGPSYRSNSVSAPVGRKRFSPTTGGEAGKRIKKDASNRKVRRPPRAVLPALPREFVFFAPLVGAAGRSGPELPLELGFGSRWSLTF
ncbi:MAG: hypothetical protein IJE97_00865, partial [Thermoguttaceae bacterium]|nr:hypothetical protein [Thermoguttaceae bacterium]